MKRKLLALTMAATMVLSTMSAYTFAYAEDISVDCIDDVNGRDLNSSNETAVETDFSEVADGEDETLIDESSSEVNNDDIEITEDEDSDEEELKEEVESDEIDTSEITSEIDESVNSENDSDVLANLQEEFATVSNSSSNAAPYSSIEKLEDGEYTVTANVYVPGELNKVLTGTNAFLTNPKYPFGTGADYGTPVKAMYYNAQLIVNDDDITLKLELKNPVFQALQIDGGTNASVENIEYNEELSDSEVHKKYGKKIQTITFKLNDYSGFYQLNNCVEYASILNSFDGVKEDTYLWNVPLNLAVDFQGIGKEETSVTTRFVNEDLKVGLVTQRELPEGTQEDIHEVTAESDGEEAVLYKTISEYLTSSSLDVDSLDFHIFYVGLKDSNGNSIQNIAQYAPTLYTSAYDFFTKTDGLESQLLCRWKDGTLSDRVEKSNPDVVQDLAEISMELKDSYAWEEEFDGGYVIICNTGSEIPFEYCVGDSNTDLGMIYHSTSGHLNDTQLYMIKTAVDKYGINDSSLEEILKSNTEYSKLKYHTYQIAMYDSQNSPNSGSILRNAVGLTSLDVELPVSDAENYQVYEIVYDRDNETYTSVKEIKDYKIEDKKIVINAYPLDETTRNKVIVCQRLYGAATDDAEYSGSRAKRNIQYYAIVSEGAVAEKPSVSDTTFTYDGTDKILIQESKYYTVSGDATAKLPGSYKATVTLNDGYAWKDGTTDSIEFTWTIEALKAEKPSAVKNLVYNRDIQVGVKEGEGYTLTNNTAKKAGTYHATAILNEGYVWSDGSSAPVTVDWSIAKYNSKITLKASSKTYKVTDVAKKSASFSIGATGVGTITYKVSKTPSGASKCISVDKNGKVIVAKNAKVGTYTVRVNASGDNNNNSATRDVTIKVFKLSQNVSVKTSYRSFWITAVSKKAQTVNIGGNGKGKITYKVTSTPSGCAKSIKVDKNGKVTVAKSAKIGDYVIRVTASGDSTYNSAYKDVKIRVVKATQKISAKVTSKTYKASDLKKKSASFTIGAKGQGKLTYKVTKTPSGASKCISVNSKGKVTVAKNAKVGTYTVRVTAAGNGNYNSATKDITIKVTK